MGNYTFFQVSENPTEERQASKKFYSKCSENSRSQIIFRTDIFRKLTLGAPGPRAVTAAFLNLYCGVFGQRPIHFEHAHLCAIPERSPFESKT